MPFSKVDEVLFTDVQQDFSHRSDLRVLGMKACGLTTVPENSLPPNLQWLILTDNKLTRLPKSIGQLTKLRKVSLAGNQLSDLPTEMEACQDIELIRLGANNFKAVPDWLLDLPQLAWYGGINHTTPPVEVAGISYHDLTLGDKLGSSPTSEVFRATIKSSGETVAVKIYHGGLTSDGWSMDDMKMCLAAGNHPNIIPVLGKLVDHPENQPGVILQLIPANFHSLGLPPSLETCTRDTFPPQTNFSLSFIVKVLQHIASACQHLHSKGIVHGDLYAHNILVNEAGDCHLGDFGAASFYNPAIDRRPEQIEVRAFRHLAEDLLQHCPTETPAWLEQLNSATNFTECLSALEK